MQHDDAFYLGHMLDSCRRIERLLAGVDRPAFDRDEPLQLAVTHLLQVVGEAARRVSAERRDEHPAIPWQAIIGMRHRLVHDYFSIDYDVVWDTVRGDIPALILALATAEGASGA